MIEEKGYTNVIIECFKVGDHGDVIRKISLLEQNEQYLVFEGKD